MIDYFIGLLSSAVIFCTIIIIYLLYQRRPISSDLLELVESLSESVRSLEAEHAANRGEILKLEDRLFNAIRIISKLSEGINILIQQLLDVEVVPKWDMPSDIDSWLSIKPKSLSDRHIEMHIYQFINEHFSLDEIKELCFLLNIDYDSIVGETKFGKARELVLIMVRQNKIDALTEKVKQLRPFYNNP